MVSSRSRIQRLWEWRCLVLGEDRAIQLLGGGKLALDVNGLLQYQGHHGLQAKVV